VAREAETGLLGPHVEIPGAPVAGLVVRPIVCLEAAVAVAADDDAGEQRRAVARISLRTGPPSVLAHRLLVRQVAFPGDVGRQAIPLKDFSVRDSGYSLRAGGRVSGLPARDNRTHLKLADAPGFTIMPATCASAIWVENYGSHLFPFGV
jgi:hypothetical protein